MTRMGMGYQVVTESLVRCQELFRHAGIVGRFYVMRKSWDKDTPCPVHPTHGPMKTPPWVLVEVIVKRCAAIHVHHAEIYSAAPWEPPDSAENKRCMALAEYVAAAMNNLGALLEGTSEERRSARDGPLQGP